MRRAAITAAFALVGSNAFTPQSPGAWTRKLKSTNFLLGAGELLCLAGMLAVPVENITASSWANVALLARRFDKVSSVLLALSTNIRLFSRPQVRGDQGLGVREGHFWLRRG